VRAQFVSAAATPPGEDGFAKLQPHIYATAAAALQALGQEGGGDQSILVSGESGAQSLLNTQHI
jgi:myosin heavy subunit